MPGLDIEKLNITRGYKDDEEIRGRDVIYREYCLCDDIGDAEKFHPLRSRKSPLIHLSILTVMSLEGSYHQARTLGGGRKWYHFIATPS